MAFCVASSMHAKPIPNSLSQASGQLPTELYDEAVTSNSLDVGTGVGEGADTMVYVGEQSRDIIVNFIWQCCITPRHIFCVTIVSAAEISPMVYSLSCSPGLSSRARFSIFCTKNWEWLYSLQIGVACVGRFPISFSIGRTQTVPKKIPSISSSHQLIVSEC